MSGDNSTTTTQSKNWDEEKKRLECEKLKAEIAQASLAWWKRPGYMGSLVPIVLAVAGIFSGWVTGFFDQQRENLENRIAILQSQKEDLDKDVAEAEEKRDEAIAEEKKARRAIDEMYLQMKLRSFSSSYALGMATWDPNAKNDLQAIKDDSDKVQDPELRNRMSKLVQDYEIAWDMIVFAKESLREIESFLEEVPASDRAKKLQPTPDDKLIDANGKVYTPDQIGKFLDEAS